MAPDDFGIGISHWNSRGACARIRFFKCQRAKAGWRGGSIAAVCRLSRAPQRR
jgi:hypothetical protein